MEKLAAGIRTVNLLWQKEIKGLVPLSDFALSSEGNCLILRPDELRPRTYHLESINKQGSVNKLFTFTSEAIRQFALSGDEHCLLIVTENEFLYYLKEGKKTRLFSDRRNLYYDDLSISSSGDLIALVCYDSFHQFAHLILADSLGQELWSRELPSRGRTLYMSGDAQNIIVGTEEGSLLMYDGYGNIKWCSSGEEGVTDIAASKDLAYIAAATRKNEVLVFNNQGEVLWKHSVEAEVTKLAFSGSGEYIVFISQLPEGESRLNFLTSRVSLIWEYRIKNKFTSLSISEEGKYLAAASQDGQIYLFEMVFKGSKEAALEESKKYYQEGMDFCHKGDYFNAFQALSQCLKFNPTNLEANAALKRTKEALLNQYFEQAQEAFTQSQYARCVEICQKLFQLEPFHEEGQKLLTEAHKKLIELHFNLGIERYKEGRFEEALERFEAVLEHDFTNELAREYLRKVYQEMAKKYFDQGVESLKSGQYSQALSWFEEALGLDPSIPGGEECLKKAQIELACQNALGFYQQGKYLEALFEFRKVLDLDPENEVARRHLEYVKSFLSDRLISERFTKLE